MSSVEEVEERPALRAGQRGIAPKDRPELQSSFRSDIRIAAGPHRTRNSSPALRMRLSWHASPVGAIKLSEVSRRALRFQRGCRWLARLLLVGEGSEFS